MATTMDEFMKDFTPEERAAVAARTAVLIEEELTLRDLRQAEHLTQVRMAELMGVEQEAVSRLERRADLLLSTLSSYVAAMGGKLRHRNGRNRTEATLEESASAGIHVEVLILGLENLWAG
jgi:DNA-binding XRE family transcriptional regulator